MKVVNNGPRGQSQGCCYGRSLSEITRGALQYLQNLGFTSPQKHETTISGQEGNTDNWSNKLRNKSIENDLKISAFLCQFSYESAPK